MASHTSCKPIFTVSAIRNGIPKIWNQKHTNRVHITVIHICIHTHNNSNTQTHGENTHTRHNWERDRKRKRECVREREGKGGSDLWWLTERFETVAVAIGSRSSGGVDERRRWRCGVESDREWGFVGEFGVKSDRSELGGESELRVFSI